MNARNTILARISAALADQRAEKTPSEIADEWQALLRGYERTPRLASKEKISLLMERLHDYDAEVSLVTEQDIAAKIAQIVSARGNRPPLIPQGFPSFWIPKEAPLTTDDGSSAQRLSDFDGVITASTLAIAETGSTVLCSVLGQGRRAVTLVPDFLLCIVRTANRFRPAGERGG